MTETTAKISLALTAMLLTAEAPVNKSNPGNTTVQYCAVLEYKITADAPIDDSFWASLLDDIAKFKQYANEHCKRADPLHLDVELKNHEQP